MRHRQAGCREEEALGEQSAGGMADPARIGRRSGEERRREDGSRQAQFDQEVPARLDFVAAMR
jgi:hypothetical protein